MEIILATQEYASALSEIHNSCFAEPWSELDFADRMADNSLWKFFIITKKSVPVGYLGSYSILDEASIANIAVVEKYRNSGYGSCVLAHFIEFCKKANISKIMLEVRKSNMAAISLYKKHGFEAVGISKNHYTDPTEDALLMNKIL